MRRTLKGAIKTVLGRTLLRLYIPLRRVLIQTQCRELMSRFGHCEPDLELLYPWDIREEANIFIGRDVFIGPGVLMVADRGAEIHIGNKVMFGPRVRLVASDHRYDDPDRAIKDSGYGVLSGVHIGDDVWLGTGVTILKGVRVGEGAVIGAGSVVTKDVGRCEVWAGNPAKKIRDRFPARQVVAQH